MDRGASDHQLPQTGRTSSRPVDLQGSSLCLTWMAGSTPHTGHWKQRASTAEPAPRKALRASHHRVNPRLMRMDSCGPENGQRHVAGAGIVRSGAARLTGGVLPEGRPVRQAGWQASAMPLAAGADTGAGCPICKASKQAGRHSPAWKPRTSRCGWRIGGNNRQWLGSAGHLPPCHGCPRACSAWPHPNARPYTLPPIQHTPTCDTRGSSRCQGPSPAQCTFLQRTGGQGERGSSDAEALPTAVLSAGRGNL